MEALLDYLKDLGMSILNAYIDFMRSDTPGEMVTDIANMVKDFGNEMINLIRDIIDSYVN